MNPIENTSVCSAQRQSLRRGGRVGFTLIEMLVVLAIIALLAALSIGALVVLPERARVRATEATIAKLSTALERKVAAIHQAQGNVRVYAVDVWLDAGLVPDRKSVV